MRKWDLFSPTCGVNQSARALFSADLGRSLYQPGDPTPHVVKDSSKHSVCNVCVCVMLLCLKAQCPAIMWCQIWWKLVSGLEKKGKCVGLLLFFWIIQWQHNNYCNRPLCNLLCGAGCWHWIWRGNSWHPLLSGMMTVVSIFPLLGVTCVRVLVSLLSSCAEIELYALAKT